MEFQIIPKQDTNPAYDQDTIAIKSIEYFATITHYNEQEITSAALTEMMEDIRTGVGGIYLYTGSDEESDWMEVVSDGEWLFLGCCFDSVDNDDNDYDYYYCYNPEFADTADLIDDADFSDEAIYSNLESGGQSPIPKIQAIQDMEAGIKAVEYFIHTGKLYPGTDWLKA